MTIRSCVRVVAFAAAVASNVACNNDTKPTPVPTPTPTPTPTVTPGSVVTGVYITGGRILRFVGDSVKLTAMATYNNGAQRDITAEATWSSTYPDVIGVEGGQATAMALGESGVNARFEKFNTPVSIQATPVGTFVISGYVREPGLGPLGGVRVSSTSQTSFVTLKSGDFTLGGLTERRLILEKDGYETAEFSGSDLEFPWLPVQKIISVAPDGQTQLRIAPHDVLYTVAGKTCYPCKSVRLTNAIGLRVRVTATWSGPLKVDLLTETGQSASLTNPNTLTIDLQNDHDVRLYVASLSASYNQYVDVTVTVARIFQP